MIRSMTGYGRAVARGEGLQVAVEVASVNRKNLDVTVSLPREWQRLEPEIADAVRAKVQRGRISILVTPEAPGGGEAAFFNAPEIEAALGELRALSNQLGISFDPDLNLLFSVAAATRSKPAAAEAEKISPAVLEAVDAAVAEMIDMRAKEGEALRQDLSDRRLTLLNNLQRIREASTDVVPNYRETLLKRLRQSGLEFTLEDERVLKEIAIFADRCDVSEELTRLESHLAQFEEFLESADPVGRKLEFLLQEIGRELNTVGSKASESAVSRLVIDSKNELERIREQALNVE